jgi:branched-subunit amino acid transport protein
VDSPRERFFAGVRAQAPPLIGIVPFGLVWQISVLVGIAALAIAWLTRSVTWTLVGGMVALWLVQWWIGG